MAGAEIADEVENQLAARLGPVHARQRLGIEADHEALVFSGGISFFHLENWYSVHSVIRGALRLTGLYRRGRRNAFAIEVVDHAVAFPDLPEAFEGFRILHLSDLHIDAEPSFEHRLIERVRDLDYDLCVLTGDYRFKTFGPLEATVDALARLRTHLTGDVWAVLGNHDSVRMVPALEAMGIRMLLNESTEVRRGAATLFLAGIDDAHYFGVANIEKAAENIPPSAPSILLSHTPEVYRQAAHAAFDLMLCGHTHGGQICLPGGRPMILDARVPRRLGRGGWRYHTMIGYTSRGAGTSLVHARLNCAPEITVHVLRRLQ